ncbi:MULTISPECIES: C40 family peptidase [Sphingobacterium]|uniref:C40 family peptidase n=1 Tax=Sphingobacterium TaxID=28453 RepID=UPI00104E1CF5|nr:MULTISPECIES: C40 family peptidase [unclassified Sphingobacterium]MCS3557461.1 cell wall-associated NlpC family hydrolase [Sphingobacterium sp. JUb21]TCQ96251.1 NlpC/P60 family protein [Sphingobacterium sp. JUb20]
MTNKLKYAILTCAGFFTINHAFSQALDSTVYLQVKELQETVRKAYAPDKRTKLFAFTKTDIAKNDYLIETTEPAAKTAFEQQFKNIPATVAINLLPEQNLGNKLIGIVHLSVGNMRTKPDNAAEMASQVLMGTQVDLLQKDHGEYRIRTPEGYIAWLPTSSVTAMTKEEAAQWNSQPKIIYTAEFGKSLSEPHAQSQRVSDLVYGDILVLTGEKNNYFEVSYPDKRKAYIKKEEALSLKKWVDSRNPTADNLISSAKSMLGLPYLWGGTSVKGVDCSGFTKTAYFMNGYVIPRDASQQVLAGESVDILDAEGHFDPEKALKNLKPADLLFFAAGKNTNPNARVTHVALYIGNGTFIHAAGSVRINSMLKDAANYDDFQTRTVVAAKRYLGSNDPQIQKVQNNPYYSIK